MAVVGVSLVSFAQETSRAAGLRSADGDDERLLSRQAINEVASRYIESRFGNGRSTRGPLPAQPPSSAPASATADLIVPISRAVIAASPTPDAASPTGATLQTETPNVAAQPSAGAPQTAGPITVSGAAWSFAANNVLGIDLAALSRSGAAYDRVRSLAAKGGSLNYGDNEGPGNEVLLAKAVLGDKAGVLAMVRAAKGTLTPGIIHNAAARNLAATAISLNLVNAHEEDAWLLTARDMAYDGGQQTLLYTAGRSNNHGSAADQSLVAIDLHLNDRAHLESRVIPIIRQRLGDEMGIELRFGDSVQADPNRPVTIGRPGTFAEGVSLDGLLLEEQRREAGFPNCGGYNFGASGQILISVWMLEAAGYSAAAWGQNAIHRVYGRLVSMGCTPEGDDRWQGHMYNALAGRQILPLAVGDGKTIGLTDYLFSGR